MLLGLPQAGTDPIAVGSSELYGLRCSIPSGTVTQALSKISVYMDGGGGGGAQQVIALFYRGGATGDVLLATSLPVTIVPGQAAGWVDFLSPTLTGMLLNPDTYTIALYGLPGGNAARILGVLHANENAGYAAVTTPEDETLPGSLASPGAWTGISDGLPFYATLFESWSAPDNVTDVYLGRLPWELSQRAFGAAGAIPRGNLGEIPEVVVGWHGVNFDVETGAFALARIGGAMEGYVGERILVIRRYGVYQATAAVLLYAARNFPDETQDEDISLTRRAFLAISGWAQDTVTCDVLPLPT